MRESIGGAFLFNLVLIFLGVYVTVLAFAIVYAKAFNSKNHIVNIIEQHNGLDQSAVSEISNYMNSRVGSMGITDSFCSNLYSKENNVQNSGNFKNITRMNGACIFELKSGNAKTYQVYTFMDVDIPFLSSVLKNIPISGGTKAIYEYKSDTSIDSSLTCEKYCSVETGYKYMCRYPNGIEEVLEGDCKPACETICSAETGYRNKCKYPDGFVEDIEGNCMPDCEMVCSAATGYKNACRYSDGRLEYMDGGCQPTYDKCQTYCDGTYLVTACPYKEPVYGGPCSGSYSGNFYR